MFDRIIYVTVSIYQYIMPILTSVYLLIIPLIQKQQYSNSIFIDRMVQYFLLIYFFFGYISISIKLKNRINKKVGYGYIMNKGFNSLLLLSVSAIGSGILLFLLTQWSMVMFAIYLPEELIFIISFINGFLYGMLVLLQYHFLPEKAF